MGARSDASDDGNAENGVDNSLEVYVCSHFPIDDCTVSVNNNRVGIG